jgi:hypothetical protein
MSDLGMAQFPRNFLLATPTEVLAVVLSHLDASDLLALFLGGDSLLNHRLTHPSCVTEFKLNLDGRHLRFPRFAYFFPSIRSFSIQLGYFCTLYGASKVAYTKLPPSLRQVRILADSPGFALTSTYNRLLAADMTLTQREHHFGLMLTDLALTFPLLDTLELHGNASELTEPLVVFPPCLTRLDLGSAHIRHATDFVKSLPTSLTSLKIDQNTMQDADISSLPQGLLCLSMGFSKLLTPQFVKLLPEGLQRLSFASAIFEARAVLAELPPNLQLLSWSTRQLILADSDSLLPISLPLSLTELALTQVLPGSDNILPCNLPPTLRRLEVFGVKLGLPTTPSDLLPQLTSYSGDFITPSTAKFLQMLQPKLSHLHLRTATQIRAQEFAVFPPGLNSLLIEGETWELDDECIIQLSRACPTLQELTVNAASATWRCVEFLPRTLVQLDCSTNMDILSPTSITNLPCDLRLLLVGRQSQFTSSCVPHLPKNLEWFHASSLEIVDEDIALLPRSIRSLRISQGGPKSERAALSSACVKTLPPRLTALTILSTTSFDDSCISDLPRSLVALRLPQTFSITQSSLHRLPIGLHCFSVGNMGLSSQYFDFQQGTLSKKIGRGSRLKDLV